MNSRINIEAVGALALKLALERCEKASMGNGVTDVFVEKDEGLIEWLMFTVERYAMDGAGFHAGYETFIGAMQIFHGPDLGILSLMTPHAKEVVFPSAMDVSEIIPAEDPHEYTVEEARAFLEEWHDHLEALDSDDADYILQTAFDYGMGEGDYCPPDDDFAYQELDHHLQEALKDLPDGRFDPETRAWSIVFDDGEIAIQYPPVRAIATLQ